MGRRSKAEVEEMETLRQENADLRRMVSRLRKRLQKFNDTEGSAEDETPAPPPPANHHGPKCPKCGGQDLRPFNTPSSRLLICGGCKTRLKA